MATWRVLYQTSSGAKDQINVNAPDNLDTAGKVLASLKNGAVPSAVFAPESLIAVVKFD